MNVNKLHHLPKLRRGISTSAATIAVGLSAVALTACSSGPKAAGKDIDCTQPLTIAHATNEVWGLTAKLAESEGFFKDEGIEVEKQVLFEGDSQVAQALQARQADVGLASGYAIFGTLKSGRPMTMTALLAAKETDTLVVKPSIKEPSDLEGKVIAINDIGGGTHASVVWALEELGVDPDDVTLTQVGAQSDRLAAVIGGSAATAPVDRAIRADVEKAGLRVLIDLAETDIESAKHGVIFLKEFTEQCSDTAQGFTNALAKAQAIVLKDADAAGEALAKWQEVDTAVGVQQVEDAESLLAVQACMEPTEKAFQTSLDFLKVTNPAVGEMKASDGFTTAYVEKLKENGTFDDLGIDCG